MEYLYIIEVTSTGFSAYFPDLPGCVATGKTKVTLERNLKTALQAHLDGMREDGLAIPKPLSEAKYIKLSA